jgi:16S rRNA (cytidine1402-2'-O)-methyltransferase
MTDALADLAAGLGAREAAICRELTKLHEEVRRGDLASLARDCAGEAQMRGEMVIVIAAPQPAPEITAGDLDALLRSALDRLSLKEAVEEIAALSAVPRRTIYQRALALRAAHGREDDRG